MTKARKPTTLLLLSYDLKHGTAEQYEQVINTIKEGASWWHYLESTWLLSTAETPEEVAVRVHAAMHPNDRLLVIEVTKNYGGWLPKKAWEWIAAHEPQV